MWSIFGLFLGKALLLLKFPQQLLCMCRFFFSIPNSGCMVQNPNFRFSTLASKSLPFVIFCGGQNSFTIKGNTGLEISITQKKL